MVESFFISSVVIAITELLKRINLKDWIGVGVIVAAAIVGLISGALHIEGLDPVNGLLAGLAAAGLIRLGQAVGGK